MRLYLEPITLGIVKNRLREIRWRKRVFRVSEILERWVSQSKWWADEERRFYLRVLTSAGVLEIYRCGERWVLSRIME